MTRVQQIRQMRAEKAKAIDAIREACAAAARAMTEDERARVKALEAEFDALGEDLAIEERAENRRLALAPPAPNPEAMAAARGLAPLPAVAQVHDRAEDDPNHGFRTPREFLTAVMAAGLGARADGRLAHLRATQGSDEHGVYSDPNGGFLVPRGMAPGILALQAEEDPIAALTRDVPMRTPTVGFNARVDKTHTSSVSGGLTVTRRPETVDGTSSRMAFEQVTLTANELFGLAYATERIITDSPESFVAILEAGFRDEFAAKAMDERLNGTGVGEPLGIMNAACLVSVAKESGQGADTIQKENIDKMVARCWRYNRAVWIANHDTRPQLASLVQVIGTGGAAVQYLTGQNGGAEFLANRPIYWTEFAAKLGDVGDLVLGVWSEYLSGTYQPMRTDESIHVRFAAGERCFRFYLRNDGQPWWRSALTPKKSSATLSPFVVLAAR